MTGIWRILHVALSMWIACIAHASTETLIPYDGEEFSLRYPADWTLETNERGQILLKGTDGEEIGIWPMFVERGMAGRSMENLLLELAHHNLPDMTWQKPRRSGKKAIRISGESDAVRAIAILGWQETPRGTGIVYYLVVAPEEAFRREGKRFSTILASFRLKGSRPGRLQETGAGGAAHARLRYIRWTDPVEGMFSMEVPRGWAVEGGTHREAAIDVRPWIRVTSPDGQTEIFSGDPRIPTFTEPNDLMIMSGNVEGTWYDPGYGTRMLVLYYRPGMDFLEYFMPQWLGDCEILDGRNRQDIVEAEAGIRARWGLPGIQQDDAAEAHIRCRGKTGQRVGYVFVQTRRFQAYGVSLWQVPRLMGYLAPSGKEALARQILAHMIRTTKLDLDWLRRQGQVTGKVSDAVRETSRYISDVISKTYRHSQAVQSRATKQWARAMREVERVQDQRTGEVYEIKSGNNYAWIDANGNIVGTRTQANPDGLRFEEMLRLDR